MIRRLLLFLVVVLVLPACGAGPPDHVRIGVVAPLSGPRAWLGQEVAAGARMAVEDINREGGLLGSDVELVVVDDADLTGLSGQLADLAERRYVSAVVGPEAPGVLLGDRSPLTRRGVPALLPSAFGGDLDEANTFVARTVPSARAQAERLGRWLADHRRLHTVAVLVADPVEGDLAREDLLDGLARGGTEVAATVEAAGDAADLRPAVASLRDAAPDAGAVLLWGPPATVARATVAVRELDWDVQVAVPASAFVAEYRTLAEDASEGVVAVFPFRDDWFRSGMTSWMLQYHVREGIGLLPQLDTLVIDLPAAAIAAYDAVRVVGSAVRVANSRDPARVASALRTRSHEGLIDTYDLADHEAWSVDELFVARFHELAITFDVDPRLDGEFQRELWRAQVALDVLPEDVLEGPLGALIDEALGSSGPPPDYQPPLPPPGPVARP